MRGHYWKTLILTFNIYLCSQACLNACLSWCKYECMHVSLLVLVCVYTYTYAYMCGCMLYLCMHVCKFACMYAFVCVCIHVGKHRSICYIYIHCALSYMYQPMYALVYIILYSYSLHKVHKSGSNTKASSWTVNETDLTVRVFLS